MSKILKTLTEIKESLSRPGAVLVFDERIMVQSYFVECEGIRIRCSKTADRLTYGKNKCVNFSHRTSLERFYTPIADSRSYDAIRHAAWDNVFKS